MIIEALISQEYTTASVLEDTRDVWNFLLDCDYMAVVDEDTLILGIVTIKDLISQPESRNLLDCDLSKPKVSPGSEIFDVLSEMEKGRFDYLPVYDKETFVGVIKLIDITRQLATNVKDLTIEYHKVVHDLRNPIANISGLLKLLEEISEDNQKILSLCNTSCDHALNILDDLIVKAGNEHRPLVKEPTELNEFYENCVQDQSGLLAQKNITIDTNFCAQPYHVSVDKKQLRRAIENLLSNAIKFSFPNSIIKVSTKFEDNRLTLKILDAGIGIPENIQSEIFDDFTTARRSGTSGEPSTGLGLSLTKRCIEDHGGKIYFKSTEGKGSKFYVTL